MKIGVVFPQTEYGSDPGAVRAYAQAAESAGYDHILAYDHVLGANPERDSGWQGGYTFQDPFLEPFVLFSFMAGVTSTIQFTTGILILPQRQTALVAKQAACLDILSRGRLRLGIGIGWNKIEYIALNEDFHTRGKRSEEQVALLRQLWAEPLVQFAGRWHTIPDAGLNPLPLQRPIPIWFGGHARPVLERVARIGDGWMPTLRSAAEAAPYLAQLEQYLAQEGRSLADIGLEARLHSGMGDLDSNLKRMEEWRAVGATHISFNTMGAGFTTPDEHLSAIQEFAAAVL